MSTPFNTVKVTVIDNQPGRIVPATDGQMHFIRTLLDERDVVSRALTEPKYVSRAAALAHCLASPDITDGEGLNEILASVSRSDSDWKPLTKAGASALIEWLKGLPFKVGMTNVADRVLDYDALVPAGRYAIDTQIHAVNGTAFYRVDRPTEGRWAGYVFVKQIIGPDEQKLSMKQGTTIIRRIAEAGAEAASIRYGLEIGRCGVCHTRLTNDESRARGIGPKCASKAGW